MVDASLGEMRVSLCFVSTEMHNLVTGAFATTDQHLPTAATQECLHAAAVLLQCKCREHSKPTNSTRLRHRHIKGHDACRFVMDHSGCLSRRATPDHAFLFRNTKEGTKKQTCVVLPQPVSPHSTTTSFCSRASMTSCSMPVTGRPARTASMSSRRCT